MSLTAVTNRPKAMLARIKQLIDEGKIVTWQYDADGDFTHTPDQWRNHAWFRPYVEAGQLRFGIITGGVMTHVIYGVFHGRFIEMLATHVTDYYSEVAASSEKGPGDTWGTPAQAVQR